MQHPASMGDTAWGAAHDVYIQQEHTCDAYCEHILTLLLINNSPLFAISNPDFCPVEHGMTVEQLAAKQKEVDAKVDVVLRRSLVGRLLTTSSPLFNFYKLA